MPIRLAARAVLVHQDRLLLVNAYPGGADADPAMLWCAPGGGAELHEGLPVTLSREVYEETGLRITVGSPCLVNEFHAPEHGFHQVEIFFRCTLLGGSLTDGWRDPEGIVTHRRWFSPDELRKIRLKPDSLPKLAFSQGIAYDPLETIVS